ncbi:MAG: hypothetical protein DMF68_09955 [Acidobacteria bacterium]|nr:MAG: hypothetical protein DMF68_09955 [Acidobacteriota bacterium]
MKNNPPTYTRLVIGFSIIALVSIMASLPHAQQRKQNFNLVNKSGLAKFDSRLTQAVRPCAREDLTIKKGQSDQAMGGRISLRFVIKNVSSSPCNLQGYPSLVLLNKTGKAVKRATKDNGGDSAASVTLEPGKMGWFELDYMEYEGGTFKSCFRAARVRITLLDVTRPFVLRGNLATCAKNEFSVTAIQAGAPQ